jgi:hypothetical protein
VELRDLLITPAFLILIYGVAFLVRPYATDEVNRVYFFPALTAKIFGALALGVVYQYYYGSGDTFMYHTYGSRIVWNAFVDSPIEGLKLLFADTRNPGEVYQYASQIYLFRDSNSYTVLLAILPDILQAIPAPSWPAGDRGLLHSFGLLLGKWRPERLCHARLPGNSDLSDLSHSY